MPPVTANYGSLMHGDPGVYFKADPYDSRCYTNSACTSLSPTYMVVWANADEKSTGHIVKYTSYLSTSDTAKLFQECYFVDGAEKEVGNALYGTTFGILTRPFVESSTFVHIPHYINNSGGTYVLQTSTTGYPDWFFDFIDRRVTSYYEIRLTGYNKSRVLYNYSIPACDGKGTMLTGEIRSAPGYLYYNIQHMNGQFITIQHNTSSLWPLYEANAVFVSPDCATWIKKSVLPSSFGSYSGLRWACGNGILLGKSNNSNWIFYSSDLVNWYKTTLPETVSNYTLLFSNGFFFFRNYFTADGVTVTKTNWDNTKPDGDSMAYGNGKYVMSNRQYAYVSSDLINWSVVTLSNSGWTRQVLFGNGVFVITLDTTSVPAIFWSENTSTWTRVALGSSDEVAIGEWFGNRFLLFTRTNKVYYSSNGKQWQNLPFATSAWWFNASHFHCCGNQDMFVASCSAHAPGNIICIKGLSTLVTPHIIHNPTLVEGTGHSWDGTTTISGWSPETTSNYEDTTGYWLHWEKNPDTNGMEGRWIKVTGILSNKIDPIMNTSKTYSFVRDGYTRTGSILYKLPFITRVDGQNTLQIYNTVAYEDITGVYSTLNSPQTDATTKRVTYQLAYDSFVIKDKESSVVYTNRACTTVCPTRAIIWDDTEKARGTFKGYIIAVEPNPVSDYTKTEIPNYRLTLQKNSLGGHSISSTKKEGATSTVAIGGATHVAGSGGRKVQISFGTPGSAGGVF